MDRRKHVSLWTLTALIIALSLILTACGGGGGGGGSTDGTTSGSTNTTTSTGPTGTNPDVIPAGQAKITGTIQPDPADTSANGQQAGASVYVIGQQNNAATADANGNFTLTVDATLTGTILQAPSFWAKIFGATATAKQFGLVVLSSAKGHGKKTEVQVTESQVNTLNTIYINTVGQISGKAFLQGQADHTGIRVYIPGTSFQATTDAAGNYVMSNVPSGSYDLVRADYPGTVYHYAVVAKVTVSTNATTTLPDMLLQTNVGASGSVLINNGAAYTTSAAVKLSIAPTDSAVLMAVSEDASFTGTLTWEPVTPTKNYTFSGSYSPGKTANIYVKFADMSGLPTAGSASASIYIDTDPKATVTAPVNAGTIANTKPQLSWSYTPPMPSPKYHVQVATDAAFASIVAGQDQTNLTQAQYTLSSAIQQGTYYWRVAIIDSAGTQWNWAGPWSFTINLSSVTQNAPANGSFTMVTTPTLTWSANPNAASYIVSLATNSALTGSTTFTTAQTSYTLPAQADGTYYWAVTPVDIFSIQGTRSTVWSLVIDTTAPAGSVVINEKPLVSSTSSTMGATVTLQLSATDTYGVAAYFTRGYIGTPPLADDPGWVSITNAPTNYSAPNVSFTLSAGSGVKYAYVWFKDQAGNVSASPVSDTTKQIAFSAMTAYSNAARDVGKYPTMKIDSGGRPYLGYYDLDTATGFGRLSYTLVTSISNFPNMSWNTPNVVDSQANTDIGRWSSMVVVPNYAFFSYHDVTNTKLKFASCVLSCTTYTVDSGSFRNLGRYSSLAIQSGATYTAHISYLDYNGGGPNTNLKYAAGLNSSWTVTTLDSTTNATTASVNDPTSIALDVNNKAHISYTGGGIWALKYATNSSGTWTVNQLDSKGYKSAIAVEATTPPKVHISYSGTGGIKYATNASGSWVTTVVDGTTTAGAEKTGIFIDDLGYVHIVYVSSFNGDLMYATNRYGSWTPVLINPSSATSTFESPSIVIDMSTDIMYGFKHNYVHIGYYDSFNKKAMHSYTQLP